MNMGISAPPTTPRASTDTTQATGTGAATTTPGVTAAGNVGLGASSKSSFDRAWEENYVPPVVIPRPPLYALKMAGGNTELVRQVNEMLYADNPNPTDLMSMMDLLRGKVLELSMDGEAQSIKDRQTRIEKNQKEREVELAAAKEKMLAADRAKEKEKVWNILKSVASVVTSLAMMAAGAVLAPTGVGVALLAYGTYSLINSTMDLVDSVRDYQGKEKIGFRLSVGELAGQIAKAFGADEQTQLWVNAVTEIALALAVTVMTLGASSAATTGRVIQAVGVAGNLMQGSLQAYKGILTIQNARLKYDQAEIKSRLDRLQMNYDVLKSQLEKSNELIKSFQEALLSIWDVAADRLKTNNDAKLMIWSRGRGNMI